MNHKYAISITLSIANCCKIRRQNGKNVFRTRLEVLGRRISQKLYLESRNGCMTVEMNEGKNGNVRSRAEKDVTEGFFEKGPLS